MSESFRLFDLERASPIPRGAGLADTRIYAHRIAAALRAFLGGTGMVPPGYSGPLEQLHTVVPARFLELMPGRRAIHDETWLMQALRMFAATAPFLEIHRDLLRHLRHKVFDFDFVFERIPVVRCVMPNRDFLAPLRAADGTLMSHHSDLLYCDPCGTLNCWLPLTESRNSASLLMGSLRKSLPVLRGFFDAHGIDGNSLPDGVRRLFMDFLRADPKRLERVLTDCQPMNTPAGYTKFFDMRRIHGTGDNREAATRVSLDYRVLPVSVYREMEKRRDHLPLYYGIPLLRGGFYGQALGSDL